VLVESSKINKTKASLINVFFVYGSSVVLIINSILLVPFYLNYMNLSDYGAWLTAVAVINVVMVIDPGISTVSSQRLSKSFTENSDKDFQKYMIIINWYLLVFHYVYYARFISKSCKTNINFLAKWPIQKPQTWQ
jgi:O-antigen/teichoic acid export membrane protein